MLRIDNKIKLIISDFDGIFTDGKVIVNCDGSTSKRLSFLDVMGVSLLIKNNIKLAIISGDKSSAIDYIANRFSLEDVYQDIRVKFPIVLELIKKYNLNLNQVAYIGDDVNDLEVLSYIPNNFTVPNANYKVKAIKGIQITHANGGDGAFRELVDSVLY